MPIVVDLDVVMARRKMRLGELAQRTGITVNNLSVLKNGRARAVRFTTLEAICSALGCQPGEVLRWQPDPGGDTDEPAPSREATSSRVQVVQPAVLR